MNEAYWDSVAADYEGQVLSVFDHDVAGQVSARIAEAAQRGGGSGHAADLGCGVGKFIPSLARAFAHVHACDRSPCAIDAARSAGAAFDNVSYGCFDLAADPVPFAPVDCVLCVNVLLMPSLDERLRAWRAVTNQLAWGGTLVLVVPSLESVQLGYFAAVEARLQEGGTCAESLRCVSTAAATVEGLQQGVHPLAGLPTKHYLREELERMLPAHECEVLDVEKLMYPTVQPGSWDWLVTARRRGP